jgi:hypothetical protein
VQNVHPDANGDMWAKVVVEKAIDSKNASKQ